MSGSGQPLSADQPGQPGRDAGRPLALGGALRSAWIGYQRRLDEAMAAAGFPDRRLPDGRVLRLCTRPGQLTASQIGRELGITRQGAGKIVAALHDRGYVTLQPSLADAREKVLTLTPRGRGYLTAQRSAARQIEQELRGQLGSEALDTLFAVLGVLAGEANQPRLRDYLRYATRPDDTEPA